MVVVVAAVVEGTVGEVKMGAPTPGEVTVVVVVVVVVVGTGAMVIVKSRVVVTPVLSVAVTVTVNVPGVVGVPEIDPVGGQRQARRQSGRRPGERRVRRVSLQSRRVRRSDRAVRAASWW